MKRCNEPVFHPSGDQRCGLPVGHQETGVPQRDCLPPSECLPPVWLVDESD